MAKFLTTSAVAHCMEQVIITARKKIFLFCPYLRIHRILLERLIDTERRNVEVAIVYGKSDLKTPEKEKLLKLENLSMYYLENLHAKCYFNESNMIITSMNIHEFSEKNNREMGVLLNQENDLDAFTKAYTEAVSIIKNATKVESNNAEIKDTGYCIRCLDVIKKDSEKPLCPSCFRQWSRFKNKMYAEKYCHHCGNESKTNINTPLCQSCSNLSKIRKILTQPV